MHVLVTGGCGYTGTKLTAALLARPDCRVTVLDTQWFGNYLTPHPRLTIHVRDMRRIDDFDLAPFEAIVHLANIANDPAAELNPYASWDVNVLATMRLIDRAARAGVGQFVFASSGAVYGVRSEPQVTEDLDLIPISEYNKTKMVAERVILSYSDRVVTTIFRPATVCGCSPRMRLDLAVNLLTMQALTTGRMTVFGGRQVRPNIHIDDLVDLYLFALDRRLAGVYNAAFENLTDPRDRRADCRGGAGRDCGAAVERPAVLPAVLGQAARDGLRASEERCDRDPRAGRGVPARDGCATSRISTT